MCVACGGGIVEMKARNWFFPREKVCEWAVGTEMSGGFEVSFHRRGRNELRMNLGEVGNVSLRRRPRGAFGRCSFYLVSPTKD